MIFYIILLAENRSRMVKSGLIGEIARILNENASAERVCELCCETFKNLFYDGKCSFLCSSFFLSSLVVASNKDVIAHEQVVVPLLRAIEKAKTEQSFNLELTLLNSLLEYCNYSLLFANRKKLFICLFVWPQWKLAIKCAAVCITQCSLSCRKWKNGLCQITSMLFVQT